MSCWARADCDFCITRWKSFCRENTSHCIK